MKKLVLALLFLLVTQFAFSQVGINTTNPQAQLDIKSSNQATPSNTDGILIPKIDAFPLTNPTALQQGMMVYLTTLSAGKQPGFYYWDNTGIPQWKGFGGSTNAGWETTGNIGTNTATNFIGTTDNVDLVFKRNNISSGVISLYNTAFGNTAFSSNTLGDVNTALGFSALRDNTTGMFNVAVGAQSLIANTTGSNNVGIGTDALNRNISGDGNIAVGNTNLSYMISGSNNTAIGQESLTAATTGSGNVGLGAFAGTTVTTGSNNVAIGYGIDVPNGGTDNQLSIMNVIYGTTMNSTASGKIGIGVPVPTEKLEVAGKTKTTDLQVTNGAGAGKVLTSDAVGNATWQNAAGGTGWLTTGNAGTNSATNFMGTTDDNDVVFKRNSVKSGYVGVWNTSFGYYALNSLSSGNFNTAFGNSALNLNSTGFNNVANGYQALNWNTSGSDNVAVGQNALVNNTDGNYNVGVGSRSLNNNKGSDNTAIGYNALMSNVAGSNAVAVGSGAMQYANNTTTPFGFHQNVAVGFQALRGSAIPANNTGNSNTAIGHQSLLVNSTGTGNSAVGIFTLWENTTGSHNSALGMFALGGNTTGSRNSAFGSEVLLGNKTGSSNAGFGYRALNSNKGDANTAIGDSALYTNQTGSGNTAIGQYSLGSCVAGEYGTAIGTGAMGFYNDTTVPFTNTNVAIGTNALQGQSNPPSSNIGLRNTAIGFNSIKDNASGNGNTAIGYYTMVFNFSGTSNTVIGNEAMRQNNSGNSNTVIGNQALFQNVSGSNNIVIGNQAAYNETGSNKLYIENSNSATPLIYGEFDNNLIRINGRTEGIYTQLTANGDGQRSIYGYRTRDSQNDGTGYSNGGTNQAMSGHNYWGDVYTFGVTGYSDNDYTRTGGVLGAVSSGTYWASLGYKNSTSATYGVYATAALSTGAGRLSQSSSQSSIGGGFYGGLVGSWSKGEIGNMNSGNLFASYNSGDEYTAGKQIEIVTTATGKKAAYTVTSTEAIIYKKGKITLINGTARIDFDSDYAALLGDVPVVTTTPMGQCNGIYIESIDKNGFVIKELNNGTSNVQISWIAVGDRIDVGKEIQRDVLTDDFDNNINGVMFNENNKADTAKAMWSDGNKINFGKLPENLIEKPVKKEEKK